MKTFTLLILLLVAGRAIAQSDDYQNARVIDAITAAGIRAQYPNNPGIAQQVIDDQPKQTDHFLHSAAFVAERERKFAEIDAQIAAVNMEIARREALEKSEKPQ